ncbi:L-cystine transport system permease protein [Paenibacillus forsythiae]|uniref:L-cystine transport system permease protein n=1 Tax=Paenibacillus forsythiae TaxID=365616 RepID=A0ABU3H577_9BACL|nr:amino acid ABC transporter permease [Paenibacillus forsythiae]MDT3425886.1 L-cystine transport system permease protein [Paenibacillus forsythiae]
MKLDPGFIYDAFLQLLSALPMTLLLTGVPAAGGLLIGTGVAFIRHYRVRGLHLIVAGYVAFIRGTPALMHLFLVYFGSPVIIDFFARKLGLDFNSASIPILYYVFLAFSLTAGAYLSEFIRAGLLAVDKGQVEAAYAVGMTALQAFRRIVLPQALAVSLPNMTNVVIGLLHGSTLAFTVTVLEVFGKANIVANQNWKYFEAFIAAAILYWGITILLETASARLEKRINRYHRGGVA